MNKVTRRLSDEQPDPNPLPVSESTQQPSTRCWVAEAWVDSEGREADPHAHDVLGIFAVSVHEQYPCDAVSRLRLLQEVPQFLSGRVPVGCDTVWVFPGGYFGFDASDRAWPGFDELIVREQLPQILRICPPGARLAFGADEAGGQRQQVWVCWLDGDRSPQIRTITRRQSDLPERTLAIGPLRAAFFVCGEFTGSHTQHNGPFCGSCFLHDPVGQLADCRLLVDLAHSRIRGSVYNDPGRRLVHQLQMQRYASHGTAVLTHHHPGQQTAGRARHDSQSNWIFFRDEGRLSVDRVHVI